MQEAQKNNEVKIINSWNKNINLCIPLGTAIARTTNPIHTDFK